MARLRYNNNAGTLGASLTSSGTTITFAVAPTFATIVAPDYIPLVLEAGTANEEIVWLTAYTAAATTGTITRGQEGSTGVAHSNGTAWLHGPTAADGAPNPNPWWGDGVDGVVTISANTTLTRDMAYDTLTVNAGVTLSTAGYRIFVKNTLTNNGTIDSSGGNASGTTGGTTPTTGFLKGGSAGGPGSASGNGSPPADSGTQVDAGGAGGTSGTAPNGGPFGPGVGSTSVMVQNQRSIEFRFTGVVIRQSSGTAYIVGGTGGGGGTGDGTNAGGAGGGGGGVIFINARVIVNNGVISTNGGNGAAGAAAGNTAGGGGGGGGALFINSTSYTGTGTATANGGTGAAGHGTGTAGSNGSAGNVYNNVWAI